jgi:septum formation protein
MLLANAGIGFEAVPADIDERIVQLRSSVSAAGEVATILARQKALAVSGQRSVTRFPFVSQSTA